MAQARKFRVCNTDYAKNQDEYRTLPAYVMQPPERDALIKYRLSWKERLYVLFTGNVFFAQRTFGNPLQPIIMYVRCPLLEPKYGRDERLSEDEQKALVKMAEEDKDWWKSMKKARKQFRREQRANKRKSNVRREEGERSD